VDLKLDRHNLDFEGLPVAREKTDIQGVADSIDGWLSPSDITTLFRYGRSHGATILEVGSYLGKSTTVLLEGALSRPRWWRRPTLFTIDINARYSAATYATLNARGISKHARFLTGTLRDIDPLLGEMPARTFSPTLIFVDADHTYAGVKADTERLTQLARPGTPVILHDYRNPNTPGVTQAVDEWCAAGFATMVEDDRDGLAVVRASARCCRQPQRADRFRRNPAHPDAPETRRDRIEQHGLIGAIVNGLHHRATRLLTRSKL
jgi:predicted O-methyltransferase YrrM